MKKLFALLAVFSISILAQFEGPKIFFAQDTYDFGTVKQGEIVKHAFMIINKGDDTLNITNVVTSCGCTAFDLTKREILPGEMVALNVEFNSSGRVGEQTKYISIASNDKNNPSARVILKGVVSSEKLVKPEDTNVPKIVFDETQHDFGMVEEGNVVTHVFKFKNEGRQDLEIKDVHTSCGCTVALVSQKLLKPGEEGTIKIDFDTANRFGRVSRSISVTTNESEAPVKTLTIYAEISKKESN